MFKSKSSRSLFRISATFAFCSISTLLLAGNAHADALWYSLESGSKVELANGVTTDLTGKIALQGCGGAPANTKASKMSYRFYAINFDNSPVELESQIHNIKSAELPLFGGPGAGVSSNASMSVQRDGRVSDFTWYLQNKLEQDYGSEALVFRRKLTIANDKKSDISFHDPQQYCPDTITLSLLLKDTHTTFKAALSTSPSGEQVVNAQPKGDWKEETLGKVTIIATAIPGSEEKIHSRIKERPVEAEMPNPTAAQKANSADAPQAHTPRKSYRIRPKAILNTQPE